VNSTSTGLVAVLGDISYSTNPGGKHV